jgi:hypothetical protein
MEVNLEGELMHFGTVLYCKDAIANILSLSKIEELFKVIYDQQYGFTVIANDGTKYVFQRLSDGIYACDFSHVKQKILDESILVTTVTENESKFSKREVSAARTARAFQKRLGYVSTESAIDLIKSGNILNVPVTEQDLLRADAIYGKDIAALKGKSVKTKVDAVHFDRVFEPLIKHQVLHADIMFIDGKPFLLSISKPLCLTMVSELIDGRSIDSVKKALNLQISNYINSRHFKYGW